jgi:hypothetical protein
MNKTTSERLPHTTEADGGKYRQLRKSTDQSGGTSSIPVKEDWKQWDLVPVNSGPYSDSQSVQAQGDAASVQRAISILDR